MLIKNLRTVYVTGVAFLFYLGMLQAVATGFQRKIVLLAPLALCAALLLAYANSFQGAFIYDDLNSIAANPGVKVLWPIETPPHTAISGRPIVAWTLALNYQIGGLEPWSYHLVNWAIHALAALLAYGLVRRTLLLPFWQGRYSAGQAAALGFCVALLWGVHPLHTSAVTYIVQRAESLMGLLYFFTLYAFVRSLDAQHPMLWWSLAGLACLVGVGVKEPIVTAPLAVFAYDWLLVSGSSRAIYQRHRSLYFLLAASWIALGLKLWAGSYVGAVGVHFSDITPWTYLKTQAGVIWHYLKLVFWPQPLLLTYFWPPPRGWTEYIPQGFALLTILGISVWGFTRKNPLGLAGLIFFLALAPSSSVLPLRFEMCCEYRMYVPLLPLVAVGVLIGYWALQQLGLNARDSLRTVAGFTFLGACAFGLFTFRQNRLYHSEDRMWAHIARWQPANYKAWDMLGVALAAKGELDRAIQCHVNALRIYPGNPVALGNLSHIFLRQGKVTEAIACLEQALRSEPSPRMFTALANAQLRTGRVQEARNTLAESVRRYPDNAEFRRALEETEERLRATAPLAH